MAIDGRDVETVVESVAERIGLPETTVETTRSQFERLAAESGVRDEALPGVVTATLALAAWEDGLPVTDQEITEAWARETGEPSESTPDTETFNRQVASVAAARDLEDVPSQPTALVREYAERLDLDQEVRDTANRLLSEIYEDSPDVLANGTRPGATAAAALSLAADLLEDADVSLRELGEVAGTGQVTVRNRYQDLHAAYDGPEELTERPATAADGTGAEPADEEATPTVGPATAATEGATPAAEGDSQRAETVIDDIAAERSIEPSVRLFARGMASDVGRDLDGLGPEEVGAGAVVAGGRREDAEVDVSAVAASAGVEARAVSRALDDLAAAVDVTIPRPEPTELVEAVAEAAEVSADLREESRRALEGLGPEESEYTRRELAGGAVGFAVTAGGEEVDLSAVAGAAGADVEYVREAMGEILDRECLRLLRGEVDAEGRAWTDGLSDVDLDSAMAAVDIGPAPAVAAVYVAGRDGRPVGEDTLTLLVDED